MVWLDIRLGRLVRGYVGGLVGRWIRWYIGGYFGRLVVGWWVGGLVGWGAARVKTEEIEDKQD